MLVGNLEVRTSEFTYESMYDTWIRGSLLGLETLEGTYYFTEGSVSKSPVCTLIKCKTVK